MSELKKVWINIVTGEFSNSWQSGGILDAQDAQWTNWEEECKAASARGFKLIEYKCLNDPTFELYNQMKLR